MVYQLDTPGLEDQAVTNDKIESGTIEINRLDSTLAGALVPIGGIIMWSGTLDQINGFPNWQLCDGSAISSGALSGTNTPNLTGRFVIGTNTYDTSQSRWEETITGLNTSTGGSKNATLPSHSHTVDSHTHGNGSLSINNYTHNHVFPGDDGLQGCNAGGWTNRSTANWTYDATSNNNAGGGKVYRTSDSTNSPSVGGSTGSASPATNSQGSSEINANLPPYYALAYIIRIN